MNLLILAQDPIHEDVRVLSWLAELQLIQLNGGADQEGVTIWQGQDLAYDGLTGLQIVRSSATRHWVYCEY